MVCQPFTVVLSKYNIANARRLVPFIAAGAVGKHPATIDLASSLIAAIEERLIWNRFVL